MVVRPRSRAAKVDEVHCRRAADFGRDVEATLSGPAAREGNWENGELNGQDTGGYAPSNVAG